MIDRGKGRIWGLPILRTVDDFFRWLISANIYMVFISKVQKMILFPSFGDMYNKAQFLLFFPSISTLLMFNIARFLASFW